MKLLFDQNISFRVINSIEPIYPGSCHLSKLGLINSSDIEIWDYAKKFGFTIVTFDADFYNYSLVYGSPPKIIWIRTGNLPTNDLIQLIIKNKNVIDIFISHAEHAELACLEMINFQ